MECNCASLVLVVMYASRAECEDRLRAEFRIEMNAAVAESEQRWQNREQELQTQISELQSQLTKLQSEVNLLHNCSEYVLNTTVRLLSYISYNF